MLHYLFLLDVALLVTADQWTKYLAVAHLKGQEAIALWPGVFELTYRENPGVAFSLLENQRWIFIPVTVMVMAAVLLALIRSPLRKRWMFRLGCSMILAGGIGNLIDRIAYGYVVDFLYFKLIDFPVFNVADCCVVVGAIVFFVFLLFFCKEANDLPLRTLFFGIVKKDKHDDGR